MYDIEMHSPSDEFLVCWAAATRHLAAWPQDAVAWLKAEPMPPFLEHLSFRLGNQLFFVRLEDADGKMRPPGNPQGAVTIAKGCNGHACVMPMRFESGAWRPNVSGWGLLSASDGQAVNPPSLVTDELIEITDWELRDFAVQVVRRHLEDAGASVRSCTGDPHIDPAMWIIWEDRREWVVVRAARYPAIEAPRPRNTVVEYCSRGGLQGHFASVVVASSDQPSPMGDSPLPLWRGHIYSVHFTGLEPGATSASREHGSDGS